MGEPVLKIHCSSCGFRTEHALSKNVRKDFVYICLRCGDDTGLKEAIEFASNG